LLNRKVNILLYQDWKYTFASPDLDIGPDDYYTRPYGWLNIKAGEGSFVKVTTPFALGEDGSVNQVDIVLKETDITTSVNYASFIQSNRIEVKKRNISVSLVSNMYYRFK
jgi:hypothetical protein